MCIYADAPMKLNDLSLKPEEGDNVTDQHTKKILVKISEILKTARCDNEMFSL
jgi:uncharacterized metal-binding protein